MKTSTSVPSKIWYKFYGVFLHLLTRNSREKLLAMMGSGGYAGASCIQGSNPVLGNFNFYIVLKRRNGIKRSHELYISKKYEVPLTSIILFFYPLNSE